jgi:DNA-binding FadR family transcriptional regulator
MVVTDTTPMPLAQRRVQLSRVADVVADRLRELIVTGQLGDGDRLPRLEVLLDQFGVSGPSMREALRILESEGLITVQRGSIGGALVHRPEAKTAAYIVALVLRSQGTPVGDVFEARARLEPVCAMLCARRSDRKKTVVRELRKRNAVARRLVAHERAFEALAFNEVMTDFHTTLVQECGNKALTLVGGILDSIWLVSEREWAESSTAHGTYSNRADVLKGLECHEEVCDLIDAGKDLEVAQLMADHVEAGIIYGEIVEPSQLVDAQAVRMSRE